MGRGKKRTRRTGNRTGGTGAGDTSAAIVATGGDAYEQYRDATGQEGGRLEFLSMSQVSVDTAELTREADAIAAGAAPVADALAPEGLPVDGAGAPVDMDAVRKGYQTLMLSLTETVTAAAVPAWAVTLPEKTKLADACAEALLLWFPDQIIPPKYLAVLMIANVGYEIVQARRDPATGKLKPTRVIEKPAPAARPNTAAA